MKSRPEIAALAQDLEPVRALRPRDGLLAPALTTIAATLTMAVLLGPRADLAALVPDPMFLLRTGTLLLLGIATGVAAIRMVRPSIGGHGNGWLWALAMAGLFPASAAIMALIRMPEDMAVLDPPSGMQCIRMSMMAAALIGATLVLWLRRGAPTALNRAGWVTGLAAGSLGALAYSLHCPHNSIFYIGLWYTLAVGLSAIVGRLIVPRLIRW